MGRTGFFNAKARYRGWIRFAGRLDSRNIVHPLCCRYWRSSGYCPSCGAGRRRAWRSSAWSASYSARSTGRRTGLARQPDRVIAATSALHITTGNERCILIRRPYKTPPNASAHGTPSATTLNGRKCVPSPKPTASSSSASSTPC